MATQTVPQQSPQSQSILYGGAVRLAFDAANHKYTVTD